MAAGAGLRRYRSGATGAGPLTSADSAITVLRVTSDDVVLLSNVAEDVFDGPISATRLASYLNDSNHALFVGAVGGVVVGQVRGVIHRQPDLPTQLYIDNLGVTPAEQRRGIATALVEAIVEWGRDKGCESLWVATESDNAPAREFYAALGLEAKTLTWFEHKISRPSAAKEPQWSASPAPTIAAARPDR